MAGNEKSSITEFLSLAETIPVIDVRSPSEYAYGHIPGAVNIPLFNDDERDVIGKIYKSEGGIPAILKGLELCGADFHNKLKKAISSAQDGRLLVHCWRGGMRSEAMAWLFSFASNRLARNLASADCLLLVAPVKGLLTSQPR